MNTQLQPGQPRPFLHWALFVFAVLIGIETGGALFTTIVVFPLWASSPEAAMAWRPDLLCYLEEGDFFMFSSSLSMLAAIVVLIAGWRAPAPLRKWVLISSILFLIVFAWSAAYFIPIQDISFKGEAGTKIPRADLAAQLRRFVVLNYVRQVMVIISFVCALHASGLSYKLAAKMKD